MKGVWGVFTVRFSIRVLCLNKVLHHFRLSEGCNGYGVVAQCRPFTIPEDIGGGIEAPLACCIRMQPPEKPYQLDVGIRIQLETWDWGGDYG